MKAHIRSAHLYNALAAIRATVMSRVGKKPSLFHRAVYCRLEPDCLWLLHNGALSMALALPAETLKPQHSPEGQPGANLPCFDFADALLVLRAAPEHISLESTDKGGLRISFEQGGFVLPRRWDYKMEDKDWPEALPPGNVEGEVLADLILAVRPYSGDDDVLGCLRLSRDKGDQVRAEAMNGHKYASLSLAAPHLRAALPASGILIRHEVAFSLCQLISRKHLGDGFNLAVDMKEQKTVRRKVDDIIRHKTKKVPASLRLFGCMGCISVPLATYDYPDTLVFRKKARAAKNLLQVDASALYRALKMLEPLATDIDRCVYLKLSADRLTLERKGDLKASLSLPVRYKGDLKRIAFPLCHLTAISKGFVLQGEMSLRMTSAEGPCLISAVNDPRQIILMPMRIVEDRYGNDAEMEASA
ncbi:hypothetical protein LJC15_00045 [Desulfovibrio sp. OttesenSCG-928-G11]|nr:hypothetical protein [Desulfovibrio sp. OttesenSCG-928-G11]